MTHRHKLSSALASVLALGLVASAQAHDDSMTPKKNQERCYGAVKAGENNCSNLAGTHDCAGQAATDNDPGEWKIVPKGTCTKLGGMTTEQAKAAHAKANKK